MGAIVAQLPAAGPVDVGKLRRMLALTQYRGTVQQILVHEGCGLGISYSEDWLNASVATDGRFAAAVYGRIDNLDELCKELSGHAAAASREAPAQLLITAFRALGDGMPGRLRGIFGAVITDGRQLWCFRDQIGYAPMYFRIDSLGVLVATEAKQVVAGAGIRAEPDLELLEASYYDRLPDETRCSLRGVRRVPQRTLMTMTPAGVRSTTYWTPETLLETARYSATDVKDRFDQLMTQAVRRVITDKTVVALSGGIDSPAVAAFAAPEHQRMVGRPLAALSATYPKYPSLDERPQVELLAERFGMTLHLYEPQVRHLDQLEDWVRLCDSPVMTESLAQSTEFFMEARKLGARTVMSGDHAEFVFDMGYRYLLTHLLHSGRFGAIRSQFARRRVHGASLMGLSKEVVKALLPDFVMDGRERAHYRPRLPDWLDRRRIQEGGTPLPPRRLRWRRWQTEILSFPNISLETEAIGKAINGIDLRRPWADVDLWEFFLSLRAETKFPDVTPHKLFVRRLLRGRVPDEILTRGKVYVDEAAIAEVDYPLLRLLLVPYDFRMPGVDYDRLAARLRTGDLHFVELPYTYGLAAIHSFVYQLAHGHPIRERRPETAGLGSGIASVAVP